MRCGRCCAKRSVGFARRCRRVYRSVAGWSSLKLYQAEPRGFPLPALAVEALDVPIAARRPGSRLAASVRNGFSLLMLPARTGLSPAGDNELQQQITNPTDDLLSAWARESSGLAVARRGKSVGAAPRDGRALTYGLSPMNHTLCAGETKTARPCLRLDRNGHAHCHLHSSPSRRPEPSRIEQSDTQTLGKTSEVVLTALTQRRPVAGSASC
jgi:hypothetical protein